MPGFKRVILGRRLANDESHHAKINNVVGLSVFSSDALSSVAYATQEIMAALSSSLHHLGFAAITAGGVAHALFGLSVPVALGIVGLLIILGISYRQTIMAYPTGGGAYIVAKENLGEMAALVAGSSLLIDYILTVAVSVSSGVANITSAFPFLKGHEVFITLAAILVVAIANLRGVKESGALFAVPTYGFVLMIMILLGTGLVKALAGEGPTPAMVDTSVRTATNLSRFAFAMIFLKAFSSGCTALTGVEAISNGVQVFKEPSSKNASKTMIAMVVLLGTMFLGITLLASHFQVTYAHSADPSVVAETLLSKLAKTVYGGVGGDVGHGLPKLLYYLTQGFTFLILVVAANTAYADFPRLAALMGKDQYLPRQLSSQGDRLVFSNGIAILTVASCFLVWLLNANTDLLTPLYAVGVFTGFTLSQAGMVMHWWRYRETDGHWRAKALVNGLGTLTTGVVWADIVLNKFKMEGGYGGVWIILLIIPLMVVVLLKVHRHYIRVRSLLAASRTHEIYPRRNRVIVLVSRIHRGTLEAIRYAKAIAEHGEVEAITVDFPDEKGRASGELRRLESDWPRYCEGIPLRVLESPFRKVVEPILGEIDRMHMAEPEFTITIVIPEFVSENWWGNILHNQTALRLKAFLLTRPKTVVVSIPYHLDPEVDR